jgi:hypothetical protein
MTVLAQALINFYGEDRVGSFIKENVNYTQVKGVWARNFGEPELSNIPTSRLNPNQYPEILTASDEEALTTGSSVIRGLSYFPARKRWRRYVCFKQRGPNQTVQGTVIDITGRSGKPISLLADRLDMRNECLWFDIDNKVKISRRNTIVLGYYLRGIPQATIGNTVGLSLKGVQRVLTLLRVILTNYTQPTFEKSLQQLCAELGITNLLIEKLDWFDKESIFYSSSLGNYLQFPNYRGFPSDFAQLG